MGCIMILKASNWNVRDWGTWIPHLNTETLSKATARAGMLENLPESSLCFLPAPLQSQLGGGLLVDAKEGYYVFTGLQPIWHHASVSVLALWHI